MANIKGWAFPIQVDENGHIASVCNEDLIRQSIELILTTKRGERLLNPSFGCNLYTFMFNTVNYTTLKQMEYEAQSSINTWEKRIRELKVHAQANREEPNKVNLDISYKIDNLEEEFHYVHKVQMS